MTETADRRIIFTRGAVRVVGSPLRGIPLPAPGGGPGAGGGGQGKGTGKGQGVGGGQGTGKGRGAGLGSLAAVVIVGAGSAPASRGVVVSPPMATIGTDGWTNAPSETWTFASATTFTVATDLTATYTKGTRIKLTQSGSTKFFVVVGSSYSNPNTTVTVTGGTDYTLANAAITNQFFSYQESPQGYPTWFAYTPTATGFTGGLTLSVTMFSVVGNLCTTVIDMAGTSNLSTFTLSPPITNDTTFYTAAACLVIDSGTGQAGRVDTATASAFRLGKGFSPGGFTASGTKGASFAIPYRF